MAMKKRRKKARTVSETLKVLRDKVAESPPIDSNPKTDKTDPVEVPPPRTDWHRMWPWLAIASVLLGVIAYLNPADVPVLIWKMNLLSLAAAIGYWVDRSAFPYGRPDMLVNLGDDGDWAMGEALVFVGAMLRRAIIMASLIYATAVAV